MCDRRIHELDQWARDIERHGRMKRIFTISTTPQVRQMASNAMAAIELKYPQHFKVREKSYA